MSCSIYIFLSECLLTLSHDRTDNATLQAKVQALAIRNEESALSTALSSAGGEFLATRIYKGLDPRYGLDAPSVMEIGRSGIARQYEGDTEASTSGKDQK